jgi:hypothetical protein
VAAHIQNAEELAGLIRNGLDSLEDYGNEDYDLGIEVNEGFHETIVRVRDRASGSEYSVIVKRQSGAPREGYYCPDCYDAFGTGPSARTDCMQHMVEAHGYDPNDADMSVGENA